MSEKQLYTERSTNLVLESPPHTQILTPAVSYQEGGQKYRRDRFEEENLNCIWLLLSEKAPVCN